MSLPFFDDCCKRVDTTSGIFIECVCGKILKPRVGRAFTLGRWNNHKNYPNHFYNIVIFRKRAKIIEVKLARGDNLSNLDKNWNKQTKMKQNPMLCFLTSIA